MIKLFKREFYTRAKLLGNEYSEFNIWFSRNFICPLISHKWEFWQLISRSKCKRCLLPKDDSIAEGWLNGFAVRVAEYRKIQTPFWKIAGQAPQPWEIEEEKYMKHKGYDYFDMQIERDKKEGASYRKDMERIKNPPKWEPVEYTKQTV